MCVVLAFSAGCKQQGVSSPAASSSGASFSKNAVSAAASSGDTADFAATEAGAITQGELIFDLHNEPTDQHTNENPRLENAQFAGSYLFCDYNYFDDAQQYASYDLATGNVQKFPDDLPGNCAYESSSGAYVVMHNRYRYSASSIWEGAMNCDNVRRFVKVDLQTATSTLLEETPGGDAEGALAASGADYDRCKIRQGSYLYFDKLSEDEFITLSAVEDVTQKTFTYTVKKYDCNTDKGSAIITRTLQYGDAQKGPFTGESIERVCAMDGKIYALATRDNQHCYLDIYDAEGERLQSIAAPQLDTSLFAAPRIVGMSYYKDRPQLAVIGKYVFAKIGISNFMVLTIENDSLVTQINSAQALRPVGNLGDFIHSADHPYIYLFTWHDEEPDPFTYIYALDTATGKLSHLTFNLDPTYTHIDYLISQDTSGNLLLRMKPKDDGTSEQGLRYYLVQAQALQKQLS